MCRLAGRAPCCWWRLPLEHDLQVGIGSCGRHPNLRMPVSPSGGADRRVPLQQRHRSHGQTNAQISAVPCCVHPKLPGRDWVFSDRAPILDITEECKPDYWMSERRRRAVAHIRGFKCCPLKADLLRRVHVPGQAVPCGRGWCPNAVVQLGVSGRLISIAVAGCMCMGFSTAENLFKNLWCCARCHV